jgi:plastocyanin
MALNFPADPQLGDTYTEGSTTWQYDGTAWNVLVASGAAAVAQNTFSNIDIEGQTSIAADSTNDTLTFVAGSNITLVTDDATDSITISASATPGTQSNSFETIIVSGQPNVVAESATDQLTLVAGTGIQITTDATSDTISIASTASAGSTTFATLTDAQSASLTVDKIYLPAITQMVVTNFGTTAYRFDQWGSTNNPAIYAINGTTISFELDCEGHPFQIQDGTLTNYSVGLIHVATDGTVSTGDDAQGKESGTLYWKVPATISGTYNYQCSAHASMVGNIIVKNMVAL